LGLEPELFVNPGSGFYSALYQNHTSGDYLIAFRGTQPKSFKDWGTDFLQFAGLPASQYDAAAKLGAELAETLPGKISSTGHSLGGGLSTTAGVKGNFPAVNFNAAGLNLQTAQRLGLNLNNASSLATSHNVPGEIVSKGFNLLLIPDKSKQETLLHPGSAPLSANRHFMENVIAAIHRALIENGCK
jgi:hypothetical protein